LTNESGLDDLNAVKTYNFLKEEWSYGFATNYNATIFYNSESGMVKKVVFTKKPKTY
jgi:hypothetical protein